MPQCCLQAKEPLAVISGSAWVSTAARVPRAHMQQALPIHCPDACQVTVAIVPIDTTTGGSTASHTERAVVTINIKGTGGAGGEVGSGGKAQSATQSVATMHAGKEEGEAAQGEEDLAAWSRRAEAVQKAAADLLRLDLP